jgi:hypothetical protein
MLGHLDFLNPFFGLYFFLVDFVFKMLQQLVILLKLVIDHLGWWRRQQNVVVCNLLDLLDLPKSTLSVIEGEAVALVVLQHSNLRVVGSHLV